MAEPLLRIRFRTVKMSETWRYSNADPRQYSGTSQVVPNSQIPEEHWNPEPASRVGEASGVLDQAETLRRWIAEDWGFVRDVVVTTVGRDPERVVDVDEFLAGVRRGN